MVSVSELVFSAVDQRACPGPCTDCVTQPDPRTQPLCSTRSPSADPASQQLFGLIFGYLNFFFTNTNKWKQPKEIFIFTDCISVWYSSLLLVSKAQQDRILTCSRRSVPLYKAAWPPTVGPIGILKSDPIDLRETKETGSVLKVYAHGCSDFFFTWTQPFTGGNWSLSAPGLNTVTKQTKKQLL